MRIVYIIFISIFGNDSNSSTIVTEANHTALNF
jgi:hypothetical protein